MTSHENKELNCLTALADFKTSNRFRKGDSDHQMCNGIIFHLFATLKKARVHLKAVFTSLNTAFLPISCMVTF